MSIENIGAYSPDTVYGQLTMPFLNKPVTINAHTPYDKTNGAQQSFTQADFTKNVNDKMWQTSKEIRDVKSMELNEQLTIDIGLAETPEFPPKSVTTFQSTTLKDGSGLVYEALRNGYSAENAVKLSKGYSTYQKVMYQEKAQQPVSPLINRNYQVKS